MSTPTPTESPVERLDEGDPGDEMQRNVQYQQMYGIILITGCIRGQLAYRAVWCEQHEDYLCERTDAKFEAVQVKTKTPESGPWKWSDEGLHKSIRRFVKLDKEFPGQIISFVFASNTRCLDSDAEGMKKRSPVCLTKALTENAKLDSELASAVEDLCTKCECTQDELVSVLKRVRWQQGPSREDMRSAVVHMHIAECAECKNLDVVKLNDCLDLMLRRISRASSLSAEAGLKDYMGIAGLNASNDPYLLGKRIDVEAMKYLLSNAGMPEFRYVSATLRNKESSTDYLRVTERKLIDAGLDDYIDLMTNRMESAERHLIELQAKMDPDQFRDKLHDLIGKVRAECLEAYLNHVDLGGNNSKAMLNDVHQRMKSIENRSNGESSAFLCGVASLLTGDCQIWWCTRRSAVTSEVVE